jgi:hypothetical protein
MPAAVIQVFEMIGINHADRKNAAFQLAGRKKPIGFNQDSSPVE